MARAKSLGPTLLVALGAALLVGGAWLGFSQGQAREVTRVAALPRAAPQELAHLPGGAGVLLEGRLRPGAALNEQGFAVYEEQYFLRQESSGASKGRDVWGARSVERPAIGVEQAEQGVPLCNEDYLLVRPPHRWQSDVVPRAGDLSRPATTRRQGFKPGDAVTVDGIVSRATGPSCIRAKALFGGDADGYREEQRAGIVVLRVVGGIFGALGALVLTLGVLLRRAHPR